MKHFFKAIPLILFVVLLNISSCQRHDEITESEIESKSPGMFIKTIPREHLKEMSPSVYSNIQKINSAQLDPHAKEDTSSIGFHINDTEIQVIENEHFTTYTCFISRDYQTPNILENYTLKEYNDGTYEQYVLGYHYIINGAGTMVFDTSVLDIEVVNDEGILLNKEAGCLPEFVQVIDDYVCTENTRCTGNGQHEAGSSGCLCTPSPSTCDPAGSVTCDYTYVWVYNDCSSSGTTDNSNNDTTNSNTPSGGNSNISSDDETLTIPVTDPEPVWEFVLNCINGLTLPGQIDNTTIDTDIIDIMRLSNNQWTTFSTNLSDNNCSETAQEEVIEDILDVFDDYQIINELEGKSLCIYNKLKKLQGGFKNSIKKFEGEFPVAHLKFENQSLSGTKKGKTVAPNSLAGSSNSPDYVITVIINNSNNSYGYQQRPNLMVAKTIVHEVLHAEMFRKLMSLTLEPNFNLVTRSQLETLLSNGDYPGIYDYYRRHKNWQHQQMATHYRESIARILQEFDTGTPVPDTEQPQLLYLDLSWEGLRYSTIDTWNDLPLTEKTRVNGVISNYLTNNSNQICTE